MADLKRHLRNAVSCCLQTIVVLGLAVLHLLACMVCTKYAYEVEIRPLATVLEGMAYVLLLPVIAFRKGPFWINSLLWGFALWGALAWLSRKRLETKRIATTSPVVPPS